MQDSIDTIISNALIIKKENLNKNIKIIIKQIQKAIYNNKEAIFQTNKIDKKNNNGFMMDFDIIDNIFKLAEKENLFYGDVILSQKDKDKKIIYGKQIMDYGTIVVINDGNPYTIIEMAVRNIMAGNTVIFSNDGFMYGTNQLIIKIIQSVLEQFSISKNLIQIFITENIDEVLSNYANIDLVICIGNQKLQRLVLSKSKIKTITSGYENFDIYMDDELYIDFIDKILDTGLDFQLYINSKLSIDYPNSILVDDIEEAIAQINYTGSKYSAAIFTKSPQNASNFMANVKSKMVTVNTSPTIERILDIEQKDLFKEKIVVYPLTFIVNDHGEKIEL